jgi:hypothetical protein
MQAVEFLAEHAFTTPQAWLQPAIVNRFRHYNVADTLLRQQNALLEHLLSEWRFRLLTDAEMLAPQEAYTGAELLGDVQNKLWQELDSQQPLIDAYRRHLQRVYLQHIAKPLSSGHGWQSDLRAVARGALQELAQRIDLSLSKCKDRMTVLHLQDCRKEIETVLNPR